MYQLRPARDKPEQMTSSRLHRCSSPLPRLSKRLDVLIPRPQEVDEIQSLVLARLADAQEKQVIVECILSQTALYRLPQTSESLDGMFGMVVVPWNAIVVSGILITKREADGQTLPRRWA